MPYRSLTEGVVWIPEEAFVRAGAEGFVEEVVASSGSRVSAGDPILRLSNQELATRERLLAARAKELEARRTQLFATDPVAADIATEQLREAQERLRRTREEIADLTVRGRADGFLLVPVPEDLPGRFVRKGALIGYVLERERVTVRAVVSQERIDMVRNETLEVQVRLSERMDETVAATIKRIVPGGSEALPSPVLGAAGGGQIATNPSDGEGLTAVEKVFQIDLELPSSTDFVNLGGRVYIRFDHGWTPLAFQWYFQVRQLFLSRFDV